MDLRRVRGKERVFGEKKADSSSSSSASSVRRENKEVLDDNFNVRERVRGLRLEENGAAQKKEFVERYSRLSEFPIDNRVPGNDLDMNRSESVNSSVGDISSQLRYLAGPLRSRESMDQWGVERRRYEGFYGNPRAAAEQGRMPMSAYPNEGPSNYQLDSFHGYGEQNYDVNGVENGPDRAELLRKLDELKEQLRRSYDVGDKPRDMVPPERSRTPPDPYGDRLTYNLSLQQEYVVEKHMPRSPHLNYSHGPVPFMDHHNIDMQSFNPPQKNNLNVIPEYDDPSQPQMSRRPPLRYAQPQPHECPMGQHMGFNRNPVASYLHEHVVHSPACTCSGCYNQNWVVPPQVPPHADFGNRSIPKGPVNLNSYHHVNPVTCGPRNYPRNASPMLHTRWQGDVDSDMDGYGDRYLRKNKKAQISRPFRGGAPFITCFHCFELLKLPSKFKKRSNKQAELRCGSCLTVISLELNNKRLTTSAPKESKQSSAEVDQNSKEVSKGNILSSPNCLIADDTNSCHDDLGNPGQNFQLIVAEDYSLAEDERLNLEKSEKREGHSSSSSISSKEEEDSPHSMIIQRDVSDSAELLTKDACSPIAPGSPLWEQPDGPSRQEVSRDEKGTKDAENVLFSRIPLGTRDACKDQEKVPITRSPSEHNSVKDKDMSVETEVDDSFNDYLNTNMSQDSTEASKEDRPKIRKGTDNFLVGLIKRSFKDSSKSNQTVERTKVLINGQSIPDHIVRKAEKLAGPIQPGDYWYDFRAGFWGVMGHSCLGIIPPFIEEFSYPMPTNCGAGNTGVYVNGRELHQRDLDLLASRGLPTTRERFYILEISGRLMDEDSGEELKSLGRLAPTIEKVKHGFGMKVPRLV